MNNDDTVSKKTLLTSSAPNVETPTSKNALEYKTTSSMDSLPMRRKIKIKEGFKKFKRNSSSLISNVPIIGPGSPRPTVVKQLPEKRQRQISVTLTILGSEKVGKTSLIEKYIQKVFYNENTPTVGPMFYARNISEMLDNSTTLSIRLKIWDTPGNELMKPLVSVWTKATDITFVLYSLTDPSENSFKSAQDYIQLAKQTAKESSAFITLVGTKLDELEANKKLKRGVIKSQVEEYCKKESINYREISSLTGYGVEELFNSIVVHIKRDVAAKERMAPPKWTPDRECSRCTKCEVSWSVANRRHHCRRCGDVFCGKCASKFIPIPQIGKLTPTRVCDECFDFIIGDV